jgi:choline dehydrogenase-like flavoprotein
VHANFSSPSVLLPPAMATGRLTIRTNAMAREVTVGADGLATGVSYIDKTTGREHHVRARAVVLAASACESARILLNSRSSRFPDGLANSSGTVGKYLTDTTGVGVTGFIPKLMDGVPHNEDGVGGAHLYMPWWLDNRTLDFPRGYHVEISGGRNMPLAGFGGNIVRFSGLDGGREVGGYGAGLKQEYRRFYGATIHLAGRGEMIPNADSYCEIDPNTVDRWGIPVLRFHWRWSEHEHRQVRHMQETFRAIIGEMGGTPLGRVPGPERGYGIANGGTIIHELGVTRMGRDPKSSVLNANCQAHDVGNLFVADGGPFVSQADKNPTWTILALAWRTSDFIAASMRRGEL